VNVVFGCPGCGKGVELETGESSTCGKCGAAIELPMTQTPAPCLVCECPEVYKHRDFNTKLGIALIALGAILCLVLASFWPLVIAAAIDGILYFTISDVGICYRCKAHYRETDAISMLPAFDLERFEHYRWEKARAEGRIEARAPSEE
jgi:hypothetical protein